MSAFGLAVLTVLVSLPALAGWREARTPHFLIYSDGPEDQLRSTASRLEDYDRLLRTLTDTPPARPGDRFQIYMVGSSERFGALGGPDIKALSLYFPTYNGTALASVRTDRPGISSTEILQNGYALHFMMHGRPAYYPSWYVRGFSEYLMTARISDGAAEVGRPNTARAISLMKGTWLPLDVVLTGNLPDTSVEKRNQYQAQSWLLVRYLFATKDRTQTLQRYLKALEQQQSEPEAFQAAFGMDHAGLERALRRYTNERLTFGTVDMPVLYSPDAVEIRTLPESAEQLLLPQAAAVLKTVVGPQRQKFLADLRKEAAQFLTDPFARRALATVEIEYGDRAGGTRIVDSLLAENPDDTGLLHLRGLASYYDGLKYPNRQWQLFAEAQSWFARAIKSDPDFYPSHYYYGRSLRAGPQPPVEQALEEMKRAHDLAPQVLEYVIGLANVLVGEKRYDEAQALLIPLSADPYRSTARQARDMLYKLRRADFSPAPVGEQ